MTTISQDNEALLANKLPPPVQKLRAAIVRKWDQYLEIGLAEMKKPMPDHEIIRRMGIMSNTLGMIVADIDALEY